MPDLRTSLVGEAWLHAVVTLRHCMQVLHADGLAFKSVPAIIPSCFPLRTLRKLAENLCAILVPSPFGACLARACIVIVRVLCQRETVVGRGVRVRSQQNGECGAGATLPFALTSTDDLAYSVASA